MASGIGLHGGAKSRVTVFAQRRREATGDSQAVRAGHWERVDARAATAGAGGDVRAAARRLTLAHSGAYDKT